MKTPSFERLLTQKIAIYGAGKEGSSTYFFLRKNVPQLRLTILDQKKMDELDPLFQKAIQEDRLADFYHFDKNLPSEKKALLLQNYDLVFKSAGITPFSSDIESAKQHQVQFSSATQLFFDYCPGKIIGVTGTKGKSTTTAFIAHILQQTDHPVQLAGNIGKPMLSTLQKPLFESTQTYARTWYVLELSSHQLLHLTKSPHIAVVQAITPEHLDYYPSFDQYVSAKQSICSFQSKQDIVLFNADSYITSHLVSASLAHKISFSLEQSHTFLNQIGVEKSDIPVVGEHNYLNIIPGLILGKKFGLSDQQLAHGIKSFQPLPHRLERVVVQNGIHFFNDSLSTTPEATKAAVESFSSHPIILIAGGYDRGIDHSDLVSHLQKVSIKKLILLPETSTHIQSLLQQKNISIPTITVSTMSEAVKEAKYVAQPGDVVLLSPAAASFNLFKDYADRGDQFKKEILN